MYSSLWSSGYVQANESMTLLFLRDRVQCLGNGKSSDKNELLRGDKNKPQISGNMRTDWLGAQGMIHIAGLDSQPCDPGQPN